MVHQYVTICSVFVLACFVGCSPSTDDCKQRVRIVTKICDANGGDSVKCMQATKDILRSHGCSKNLSPSAENTLIESMEYHREKAGKAAAQLGLADYGCASTKDAQPPTEAAIHRLLAPQGPVGADEKTIDHATFLHGFNAGHSGVCDPQKASEAPTAAPTGAPTATPTTASPTADPTSSPTAETTGAPTGAPTRPPTPVLTGKPGCKPHQGLELEGDWFLPYREAVLPEKYRNILYKNQTVDCNPASCDNPDICGIPPCKAIPRFTPVGNIMAYAISAMKIPKTSHPDLNKDLLLKANDAKKCLPATGCKIEEHVVSDGYPSNRMGKEYHALVKKMKTMKKGSEEHKAATKEVQWSRATTLNGFFMQHPGRRSGIMDKAMGTPGTVTCYPGPEKTKVTLRQYMKHGAMLARRTGPGSWISPAADNCNPYGLMVCTKAAFAALQLSLGHQARHGTEALLLYKSTWCIKGSCNKPPCPMRCYTTKKGRCFKFKKKSAIQQPCGSKKVPCNGVPVYSAIPLAFGALMPVYTSGLTSKHSSATWEELLRDGGTGKTLAPNDGQCTEEGEHASQMVLAGN